MRHSSINTAIKRVRRKSPGQLPPSGELRFDNPLDLQPPFDILVSSANARKVNRWMQCHVCGAHFPDGSFVDMGHGMLVSSPELCYLQMAETLSLLDLIKLGFEFCGTYRYDSDAENDAGFRAELSLTSKSRIAAFLARMPGARGHKLAEKALNYVLDNSASPMETVLALMLCLPYRLGGYGFPAPQMNHRVSVTQEARKASKKRYYLCDLFWPDAKLDLEYDSNAYHANTIRIAEDSSRRNALAYMGVSVITVTGNQISNDSEMHRVAQLLSKSLEKRVRCSDKSFPKRRMVLREHLLKADSYIKIG
jgi:very-short-patch-repair endonuclease